MTRAARTVQALLVGIAGTIAFVWVGAHVAWNTPAPLLGIFPVLVLMWLAWSNIEKRAHKED